jgi:hypothetical protein
VQLALSTLKNEEATDNETDIYSIWEIPFDQCPISDAGKDHHKIN